MSECFITDAKSGGDLDGLLNDGSVLISLALQYGASLDELRKSLARDGATGAPASIIGPPRQNKGITTINSVQRDFSAASAISRWGGWLPLPTKERAD